VNAESYMDGFPSGRQGAWRSRGKEEVTELEEIRVLVIDDEAEFLETLVKRMRKRRLDARGHRVGRKAWKCCSRLLWTWWCWM